MCHANSQTIWLLQIKMTCLYLIVFPCSSYNFSCWFLDAELTLNPNWSPFFVGESVKMTCNLHKQKKLDWKYTFSRNGEQFDLCSNNSSCSLKLFGNYSGEYQCTAQRASEKPIKSNKVNLTVEGKWAKVADAELIYGTSPQTWVENLLLCWH